MNNLGWYARRLWWLGILIGAALISLIFFAVSRIRTIGANLDIMVVPGNATVSIDGQRSRDGKVKVDPGSHKIKVEREGFNSAEQTVIANTELQQLSFALTPVSDEAKSWAKKNQRAYEKAEAVGSQQAQQQGQAVVDKYPMTARLPYDAGYYTINYAVDDRAKGTIYIRIDASSAIGRQAALAQIRSWGYDPTSYKVVFPGIPNPLDPGAKEVRGE